MTKDCEILFRRLLEEDTRLPAFLSMQKIADVVGPKVFISYIPKHLFHIINHGKYCQGLHLLHLQADRGAEEDL